VHSIDSVKNITTGVATNLRNSRRPGGPSVKKRSAWTAFCSNSSCMTRVVSSSRCESSRVVMRTRSRSRRSMARSLNSVIGSLSRLNQTRTSRSSVGTTMARALLLASAAACTSACCRMARCAASVCSPYSTAKHASVALLGRSGKYVHQFGMGSVRATGFCDAYTGGSGLVTDVQVYAQAQNSQA
jgi:hypothetical protein